MIEKIIKRLQQNVTQVKGIEEYDKYNNLKNYYSFADYDILEMFKEEIIKLYDYNIGFVNDIIEINCFLKGKHNNPDTRYSDKIIIITIDGYYTKFQYNNI
jgi:hypothetical protein